MTEAESYRKKVKRQIRQGVLPEYYFAKGPHERLEEYRCRIVDKKRMRIRIKNKPTWRLVSTEFSLCGPKPLKIKLEQG